MTKTKYRAIIDKFGLTQESMAELLGISRRTSNGYANGEPIPTATAILLTLVDGGKVKVKDLQSCKP